MYNKLFSSYKCKYIISYLVAISINEKRDTAPLIDNLKIIKIFKDKDREEEVNITDFIN